MQRQKKGQITDGAGGFAQKAVVELLLAPAFYSVRGGDVSSSSKLEM